MWLVRAIELDPTDAAGVHRAGASQHGGGGSRAACLPRLTLRPDGADPGVAGKESAEGGAKVVFSPDGKIIATARKSQQVRLWDAADGRLLVPPIRCDGGRLGPGFSPDGRRLWVGTRRGYFRTPDCPRRSRL